MAPRKRGGSANAKSKAKSEQKPNSNHAVEEPKEEEKPTSKHAEEEPPTKKVRRSARNVANGEEKESAQVGVENNGAGLPSKTRDIIIEHCKQCQCFKVSALKVEKELKGALLDVEVTINPEKPRRGCFEIRDGNGTIFSLQNMPRPFTKLKQWDLDGTISEIIEKMK